MSDEPRRSGRATKGVNPKHQQQEANGFGPKKTKSKIHGTKRMPDDSPPVEDVEDEAIIRCICGIQDDEGGRIMICCDSCAAWQHNDCMGITEDENQMPEQYFCEQCRPEDHQDLVAALEQGEKPWEAAARRREDGQRKKKGRGGRKSRGGRPSKGAENQREDHALNEEEDIQEVGAHQTKVGPITPQPVAFEPSKRKYQADTGDDAVTQPSKLRKGGSIAKEEDHVVGSRRKSGTSKQTRKSSTSLAADASHLASTIDNLRNDNRKKIAVALRVKVEKLLKDMPKDELDRIPDEAKSGSSGEELSLAIENSLYQTYCKEKEDYAGEYKNHSTSILYNLGKNKALLARLLNGSLDTDELSKMTSDEMASDELQQKMASMKEEADKQAILIQDVTEGPRVRRTHKGDELVDDQAHQISSESGMRAPPPPRRRESEMVDGSTAGYSPDATGDMKSPTADTPLVPVDGGLADSTFQPNAPQSAERRSSSNFDIHNVWSSIQSADQDQERPPPLQVTRTDSSLPSMRTRIPQEDDPDIERLLEDDGNDSSPYSPAEFGTDSNVSWRGTIDMPVAAGESVAKFKAMAYHVAGTDLAGRATFGAIFPPDLVLHGRIEDKRADKYLTSLSSARSTDVTVHSVVPAVESDSLAQAQFDKLFNYFVTRQRYGVVGDKLHRPNVRDIYVVPLEDGSADMPTFLQRLDYNLVEQPRSRRMLLVVFVIRWDDTVALTNPTATQLDALGSVKSPHRQSIQGVSQIPIPRAEAAMSPIASSGDANSGFSLPQQSFQTQVNPSQFSGQFPHNPYAPPSGHTNHKESPINDDIARQILGSFYTCPTAQAIVSSQPNIAAESLRNLRQILEANPNTRTNFASFQEHLTKQNKLPGTTA